MAETITAAELAELERLVSEATSGLMASSEHFYQRVRARHAVIEALPNLIAAYRAQGADTEHLSKMNKQQYEGLRRLGGSLKIVEADRDLALARAEHWRLKAEQAEAFENRTAARAERTEAALRELAAWTRLGIKGHVNGLVHMPWHPDTPDAHAEKYRVWKLVDAALDSAPRQEVGA